MRVSSKTLVSILAAGYFPPVKGASQSFWTLLNRREDYSTSNPVHGNLDISNPENIPGGRYAFGMVLDDESSTIYVFGGVGTGEYGQTGVLNDLWRLSLYDKQWAWISGSKGVGVSASVGQIGIFDTIYNPGARRDFGFTFDSERQRIYVFGGNNGIYQFNDLWAFDIAMRKWAALPQNAESSANTPSSLSGCSLSMDQENNYFYLFGGGFTNIANDLWKFHVPTETWYQIQSYDTVGSGSSSRQHHKAVYIPDTQELYIHGGRILGSSATDELLMFSFDSYSWTLLSGGAGWDGSIEIPKPRFYHGMDYDASNDRLLIFGGFDQYGLDSPSPTFNDLWEFSFASQSWKFLAGTNNTASQGVYGTGAPAFPAGKAGTSLVASNNRKAAFLFAGLRGSTRTSINDLWRFGSGNSIASTEPTLLNGKGGKLTIHFEEPIPKNSTVFVSLESQIACSNPTVVDDDTLQCTYPPRIKDNQISLTVNWGENSGDSTFTVQYRSKPYIWWLSLYFSQKGGGLLQLQVANADDTNVGVWFSRAEDTNQRYPCTNPTLSGTYLSCFIPLNVFGEFFVTIVAFEEESDMTSDFMFTIGSRPFLQEKEWVTDRNQLSSLIDLESYIVSDIMAQTSIKIESLPRNGVLMRDGSKIESVTLIPPGNFKFYYSPQKNYWGIDFFTIRIQNSRNQWSNETSVPIVVKFLDRPPTDLKQNQILSLSNENLKNPLQIEIILSDDDDKGLFIIIDRSPRRGQWFADSTMKQPTPVKGQYFVNPQPYNNASLAFYMRPDVDGGSLFYTDFIYRVHDSGNNTIGPFSVEIRTDCPAGQYLNNWSKGDPCKQCPIGAICSETGAFYPVNSPGFFPEPGFVFAPCLPASACPQGKRIPFESNQNSFEMNYNLTFVCADGYTGNRCGSCATSFFSKSGVCTQCPQYNFNPVLVAFIVFIVLLFVIYFANVLRKLDIGFIGVLIGYCQVIAVFQTFNLRWPTPVTELFRYFSFLYLNIELASPECFVATGPTFAYEFKWYATMMLPIALAMMCFFLIIMHQIFQGVLRIIKLLLGYKDPVKIVADVSHGAPIIKTASIAEYKPSMQSKEPESAFNNVLIQSMNSGSEMSNAADLSANRRVSIQSLKKQRKPSSIVTDRGMFLKDSRSRSGTMSSENSPMDEPVNRRPSTVPFNPSSQQVVLKIAEEYDDPSSKSPDKKKGKPSMWSLATGSYDELNDTEMGGGETSFSITLFSVFLMLLKLIYISVAQKALEIFDCTFNDATQYYIYDAQSSRRCYEEWWYRMAPFAVAGIIFYVIGIPALFLALYFKRVKYLKIKKSKRTRWQQFIVRATYKPKSEFKPHTEYWDSVLLLRKLAIVACQLYFTRFIAFQSLAVIMVFIVFLYPQVAVEPYAIQSINRLEAGTLMSSALVLMCGIMFYVQEFRSEQELNLLGYAVILVICITSILIIVFLILHLRFMYRKYQRDKRKELTENQLKQQRQQQKILQRTS